MAGKTSNGRVKRFVSGHNLRGIPRTVRHRTNIGAGQRRAWLTRERMPLGSTRLASTGYVVVKVDESGRWRGAHVLLIEAELGRRLLSTEHVHHINAIKTDNRRENLHLFSSNSAHTTAHASARRLVEPLLEQLLSDGVITFDAAEGRYKRVVYDRLAASPAGPDLASTGMGPVVKQGRAQRRAPGPMPALL